MNHSFNCIRSRIPTPPLWWDENAVPRYEPFAPGDTADIYADECVLFVVACQACEREFHVCLSTSQMSRHRGEGSLASLVERQELEYGDPPNVDCCPAGPTMTSVPVRVVEFWRRERFDWVRVPELEIAVTADWAEIQ